MHSTVPLFFLMFIDIKEHFLDDEDDDDDDDDREQQPQGCVLFQGVSGSSKDGTPRNNSHPVQSAIQQVMKKEHPLNTSGLWFGPSI